MTQLALCLINRSTSLRCTHCGLTYPCASICYVDVVSGDPWCPGCGATWDPDLAELIEETRSGRLTPPVEPTPGIRLALLALTDLPAAELQCATCGVAWEHYGLLGPVLAERGPDAPVCASCALVHDPELTKMWWFYYAPHVDEVEAMFGDVERMSMLAELAGKPQERRLTGAAAIVRAASRVVYE